MTDSSGDTDKPTKAAGNTFFGLHWLKTSLVLAIVGVSVFAASASAFQVYYVPDIEHEAGKLEIAKYQRWIQDLRAKDALSRALLEERTYGFQEMTRVVSQRLAICAEQDGFTEHADTVMKNRELRMRLAELHVQLSEMHESE